MSEENTMKQIIFISAICSLTLNGMSDVAPEKIAETIEQTILQPADKSQQDQVIKCIKQVLKDDSLSAPQSLLVKDSLVKILSAKTAAVYFGDTLGDRGLSEEIIRTVFYDGTTCVEKNEYFPGGSFEVIFPKPPSPWHELSFEEFLRHYWSVRYAQDPQPRLTDSSTSQQQ